MMSEETNERLIELTDESTGETVLFEHLDTVEYNGQVYYVMTEYFEEEPEESDVYVMLLNEEDGEEALEIVEDDETIDHVFGEFKKNVGDEYEFLE